MNNKFNIVSIAVCIVAIAIIAISARLKEHGLSLLGDGVMSNHSLIHASCIGANDNGVIGTKVLGKVAVSWTVRNTSTRPLSGLYAKVGCPCDEVSGFPEQLLPGEECVVTFRFQAPEADSKDVEVPVFSEECHIAVGRLTATMESSLAAPLWVNPPSGIHIACVSGGDCIHTVTWTAIEKKGDKPMISGNVNFEGLVDSMASSLNVTSIPIASDLVKRFYELQISGSCGIDPGEYSGSFQVQANKNSIGELQWKMIVKPSVSIIPERITFERGSNKPIEVVAISRTGNAQCVVPVFDQAKFRVDIDPSSFEEENVRRFHISLVEVPSVDEECAISFFHKERSYDLFVSIE